MFSYLPTSNDSHVTAALAPPKYSLYPFLSPRPLPWTMKTGGAFRIRRVAEWLGVDNQEDTLATGGLAEGKGKIIGIDRRVSLLTNIDPAHIFSLLGKKGTSKKVFSANCHHYRDLVQSRLREYAAL